MDVAVLALGNWGTALANHLAVKGLKVIGWSSEQSIVDGINQERTHPHYLRDVRIHEGVSATTDLGQALSCSKLVMAFPSSALKELAPRMKLESGTLVVSALKGLEPETLLTPLQYAAQHLGETVELSVLSGPSFATDVIHGRPSGLVAASQREEVARKTAELFSSPSMKVYISTDPIGVELGGIAKNVIAIAAGVCDGLSMGDSARAGLITRGLAEMMRLATAMGAEARTLSGLSGLGDLVMTATCDTSRNRTVGLRLGRGERLSDILQNLGSVAEGVRTADLILEHASRHKVDMPITTHVRRLLAGELELKDAPAALLSRPTKREF
ncbi:MAG: NAD(P)-dependent glycerol-3-phosphate dehydrogenase [Deltaproteobacteria bacterium]|nr:NAD(P)-dependent glycerol-3-phosphate dehydrogenase [Deltaproteobacteria bacterium]